MTWFLAIATTIIIGELLILSTRAFFDLSSEHKRFREPFEEYMSPPIHLNCRCEVIDYDDPMIPDSEMCYEDEYSDEFMDHLIETERVLREAYDDFDQEKWDG